MPRKPSTTIRITNEARDILKTLADQLGISQAAVMEIALRKLHQQESKTMSNATEPKTITIETINTKPEHDPYTNIDGIMSKTTLKLDPQERTVWVTQEYNDNSTPSNEWHGLILTWGVNSHPTEASMREWITDNMDALTTICDGFESRWNGSNHVGSLSEEARAAKEAIEFEFDNDGGPMNYYETWGVEAWLESSMNEIAATTTDEQLADLAEQWQPNTNIIVVGDILTYITQHRDDLKWDADQDAD